MPEHLPAEQQPPVNLQLLQPPPEVVPQPQGGQPDGAAAAIDEDINADDDNNPDDTMADQITPKVAIWRGDGTDAVTIEHWCDTVDRMKTLRALNEAKAAAAACDAFRDEAALFMETLKNDSTTKEKLGNWTQLREALIERFSIHRTPLQRQGLVSALKQKPKETCKGFFDRCLYAVQLLNIECAEEVRNNADFKKATDAHISTLFLAGLRSDVREEVMSKMDEAKDNTWLVKQACTAEQAMNDRKGASKQPFSYAVAQIDDGAYGESKDDPIQALTQELAALKSRLGSGKKKATNQRSNDRPPLPPMEKRNRWIYCYNCGQYGLHVSKECQLSKEDAKKKERMPRFPAPSGTPYDAMFPNANRGGK